MAEKEKARKKPYTSLVLLFCSLGLALSANSLELPEARHLALRAGFGLDTSAMEKLKPLSRKQAIESFLSAKKQQLAAPACIEKTTPPKAERREWDNAQSQAYIRLAINCTEELRQRYVEKLIAAPSPLNERMTLFWHNHFTSSSVKVRSSAQIYGQHRLLSSNALGNFRVMLHSILNDPAMLDYLDNTNNAKDSPNENLARELLELFTLGEGQYTERDIKEAARALTGQSISREGYGTHFYPEQHDFGEKNILGEKGHFGPEGLAELLLRQSQTARFITRKVWLEFVSEPDERELKRLAARFGEDWDIAELVRGVLLSDAFWADEGKMIKSPVELLVGTARQLPGERFPIDSASKLLLRLGQPLFAPPNVKGWPTGLEWVDSSRMMLRVSFGERLTRGLAQETDEDDLEFLCAEGGPQRLAVMPPRMDVEHSDTCLAELASLLVDPVWQLK